MSPQRTPRPAGVASGTGKPAGVMIVVSAIVLLIAICATHSVGWMVIGGIMLVASLVWGFNRTQLMRRLMATVAVGLPVIVLLFQLIF